LKQISHESLQPSGDVTKTLLPDGWRPIS
jgi:hypothetical protein